MQPIFRPQRASARHIENDDDQQNSSRQNKKSHAKFGPGQLFLMRHLRPS